MRVSLIGGGTDLPAYQKAGHTGMILSFAIPYRVSVTVSQRFDDTWVIQYSHLERVSRIADIKHNIIREALIYYGIDKPLEIHIISDISTVGTGLGGSSALTCALVKAFRKYNRKSSMVRRVFQDAKSIEIDRVGAPIGIQDLIPAAHGGLNFFTIKNGLCQKIDRLYAYRFRELVKEYFLLVSETKNAEVKPHYVEQNTIGELNLDALKESADLASKYADRIISPNISEKEVIELIQKSHALKEKNKINRSTKEQNFFLKKLEDCGAAAYRRCGAGNQGFYLVYVKNKASFKKQMAGHIILDIGIESVGAQIEVRRDKVNQWN